MKTKKINKKLTIKIFLIINLLILVCILAALFIFKVNLLGVIYKETVNGTDMTLELQTDNVVSTYVVVNVMLRADRSVNLARADIIYDINTLKVKSIEMDKSIANIVIRKSFSNISGILTVEGGLSYPGFQGKGLLAKINFEKKINIVGGYVGLLSSSGIFANDGFGTNLYLFSENNLIPVR